MVWLHGFTQTRDSAHFFRSILAGNHELWTVDLPGHGDATELHASLEETADLVAELLPAHRVALGGYSLGGRVALHVATRHPQLLSHLVVLGATRGIEDAVERGARVLRDEQLATRLATIGADAFLDEWLAQAMFAAVPRDPLERAARSTRRPDSAQGLAQSLRYAGTGRQAWLTPRLSQLATPTLALAGALDAKFAAEAVAIARVVLTGAWELIDDAGHAAHLEQPQRTAERVMAFLAN